MTVGNKGRVVLPAEVRQRQNWTEGTVLIAVETDDGVLLLTRDELLKRVQTELSALGGGHVVDDFIAERRAAALREERE